MAADLSPNLELWLQLFGGCILELGCLTIGPALLCHATVCSLTSGT